MVKLGFIVEGATEKIILEKSDFFSHLRSLNIDFIPEVIDAEGNGNLLPHNIEKLTRILEQKGATTIIILTDLDTNECITHTKDRIGANDNHKVTVSIKAVEAWFLSDTEAMCKFLNDSSFVFEHPESVASPYDELRNIRLKVRNKGVGTKTILANIMVHRMGFSVLRAAKHPGCASARYFIDKVQQIGRPE